MILTELVWLAMIAGRSISMSKLRIDLVGFSSRRFCAAGKCGAVISAFDFMMLGLKDSQWPNKSPEPTAVGAVSSAVAVHVASRRWLSFFR